MRTRVAAGFNALYYSVFGSQSSTTASSPFLPSTAQLATEWRTYATGLRGLGATGQPRDDIFILAKLSDRIAAASEQKAPMSTLGPLLAEEIAAQKTVESDLGLPQK